VEDPTAVTRGRRGEVIKVAISTPKGINRGDDIYIREAREQDFLQMGQITLKGVEDYALSVYDALRSQEDSLKRYESLEIGIRLDIGISPKSSWACSAQLFINEITRWYDASFFSTRLCNSPYDQICQRYTEAINSYFPANTG